MQPRGSFPAKSNKSLSNSTFSIPFSNSFLRSTVGCFFQAVLGFLIRQFLCACFLTLFSWKTAQARPLCPKHPNPSAWVCLDGSHRESMQVLECCGVLGWPGIRSPVAAFRPVLPLPALSAAVVCGLHLRSIGLSAWTAGKLTRVTQPREF